MAIFFVEKCFRSFRTKESYEAHGGIMCCNNHVIKHKNKLIKDSRIYKEMATMMYTNKPLYGSKEEIALIIEKAKETGKDVEAEIMRTHEPGIIVLTMKPIARLI